MLRLEGFEDFREIGSGGFSTVYRARQTALHRDVAIKVLESRRVDVGKIEREVVALGRLSGIPGIIVAYELRVLDDGRPALVMALMSSSLGDLTRQGIDHREPLIGRWLPRVADALDAAHARHVFHRDLKPDNILISEAQDAYLADFGISGVDTLVPSTETAYSLTPHHASPERFAGEVEDPAADDLYSLASTIYTSFAGRPPFGTAAEGGIRGLVDRVTHGQVPPIFGLPDETQVVFARALAKQPADRYTSAVEFALDIAASMARSSGLEAPAAPDEDGELTRRRVPMVGNPAAESASVLPSADSPASVVENRGHPEPAGSAPPGVRGAGGHARSSRRRIAGLGVLAIAVLAAILAGVGWWAVQDRSSGPAAAGAQAWRADLASFETQPAPAGLSDCVADGLAGRVSDPGGFVEELTADAAAVGGGGLPDTREGSDERRSILEQIERACVPEVLPIGTELTVTGDATQVSLTRDSACALLRDGRSACWGSNWDGLAFDDDGLGPSWIENPVESTAPPAKKLIAAPFAYRCVITLDDDLHCTERLLRTLRGEQPDISEMDVYGPGLTSYLVGDSGAVGFSHAGWAGKVRDAAVGGGHACVVHTDGTVACVGVNDSGQLGDGTRANRSEPVPVGGLAPATAVAAGPHHTCALVVDGSVWCWGIDGDGFLSFDASPVRIDGLPPMAQVAAGKDFSCGVGTDASLWCWGALVDVFGDRALEGTRGPVKVDARVGATHVAVAELRVCFATTERKIQCFGDGRPLPQEVPNITDIIQVSISDSATCGVDSRGEVDCAGKVGPPDELGKPTESANTLVVPGLGGHG